MQKETLTWTSIAICFIALGLGFGYLGDEYIAVAASCCLTGGLIIGYLRQKARRSQ